MELRALATAVLEADSLAGKLAPAPAAPTDEAPGPPTRVAAPVRPAELTIAPARAVKVPPVAGMADRAQRVRILHALANHELQAAELFAWALLAFPSAPKSFRRGLAAILAEEQLHCRLYLERLAALGGRFGALPVTGHFWNKMDDVRTPLDFVCTMGLTFENANLDFAQDYARAARDAGDLATAAVLERVHLDEVRHVAFAWRWLERLKDAGETSWEAYQRSVSHPLGPSRARGRDFDRLAREAAGLAPAFIDALEAATPVRPNGRAR